MKVKNIAFSGIMAAILMGASGANAAVEIASKQYVMNQVGNKATKTELSTAQTTLQNAIDLKADQTALDATNEEVAKKANAADVYTKTEADDLLKEKANLSYVGTLETVNDTMPSSVVEYVKLKTAGIATDAALGDLGTRVTTAEGEIDTLQGTVGNETSGLVADVNALESMVGDKSVADQIATSLQSAKDYADGLATNYDAAGAADTALTDAKAYTDQKVGTLPEGTADVVALVGTKADASTVTTLSETVAGLTNAENGIAATYATKTELKATDDKAVANAEAIADIEESDYATSGIDAEKVTQIGTNTTAIATLNADAQTAGSVDNKIATAKATLLDKPVDNNCTAESGLCVLTLSKDGSKLVWIDVTDPADAE